jgi:hypothetical protein
VAPDLVHEERERVGRRRGVRDRGSRLGLADVLVADVRSRRDLDLTGCELGSQACELVLVETMVEGQCLQLGLVDDAALLSGVQECGQFFENPCCSFLVRESSSDARAA